MCKICGKENRNSTCANFVRNVWGDLEREFLSNLEGLDLDRGLVEGLDLEVEGLDLDLDWDFPDDLELLEDFELYNRLLITGDFGGERFLIGDLPEKSSLDLTGSWSLDLTSPLCYFLSGERDLLSGERSLFLLKTGNSWGVLLASVVIFLSDSPRSFALQ